MNQGWWDKRIHPRSVWGYGKTKVLWIFENASENDETKRDFQINKKYLKQGLKKIEEEKTILMHENNHKLEKTGELLSVRLRHLKQDEKKKKLFRININETKQKE